MIDKPHRILYHIVRQYFTKILQGRCLYTMKRLLQLALCTGLLATLLSIPSLAYDSSTREGDFSVLVNGEPMTFTDAVPQMRDSRSCLPFAAVFEALGFPADGITWDGTAKTVTAAREDTAISLTIGQPRITLTRGGETTTYDTDVAPYLADNRTYIPVGLVADVLGYRVGWDSAARAVIIDDVDAILAENTETYELMEQYLDYSRSFAQGNQQVTGDYSVDFVMSSTTPEETMDFDFTLDGDYEMITADSTALQFSTELGMDYTAALNGVDATELMDSYGMALPESIGLDLRGDLSTGALYLYLDCPELAEAAGLPADLWYKLDMKALYDEMYGAKSEAKRS